MAITAELVVTSRTKKRVVSQRCIELSLNSIFHTSIQPDRQDHASEAAIEIIKMQLRLEIDDLVVHPAIAAIADGLSGWWQRQGIK
ncbi:hypothetical protein [Martelella mangrovi]|uniref:Integrase n=1 Tax=Martelella mangrovi TaxID=1397477 RepID=A0ABV2IGY8_9HYPH